MANFNYDEQRRITQQWNWAASQASMRIQKNKRGAGYSKLTAVVIAVVFAVLVLVAILLRLLEVV